MRCVDLHEAANGVWLPGASVPFDARRDRPHHQSVHTGRYREAVERDLRVARRRVVALAVLTNIRSALRTDSYPR